MNEPEHKAMSYDDFFGQLQGRQAQVLAREWSLASPDGYSGPRYLIDLESIRPDMGLRGMLGKGLVVSNGMPGDMDMARYNPLSGWNPNSYFHVKVLAAPSGATPRPGQFLPLVAAIECNINGLRVMPTRHAKQYLG